MRLTRFSRYLCAAVSVLLVLTFAGTSSGEFAPPTDVPIDRLITNVTAYIKEHPNDAQGIYTLARVHSLAYDWRRDSLSVFVYEGFDKGLPNVDQYRHGYPIENKNDTATAPTAEQLKTHLDEALSNFAKAIKLDATKGLFHNSLAFTLLRATSDPPLSLPPGTVEEKPTAAELADMEKCVKRLAGNDEADRGRATNELIGYGAKAFTVIRTHWNDANPSRLQIILGRLWTEAAIAEYFEAYRLSVDKDSQIKEEPIDGFDSLVSCEAGSCYLILVKSRGAKASETANVEKVEKSIAELNAKPQGAITPIVFPLDAARPLGDLLAPDTTTRFDLDGTQRGAEWPWVKPDTAILVWDPSGSGKITSGHQLFGSVTWQMFWPDGYRALAPLDDNRDGELTGRELEGLSIWRDANGNGISDPGEVVPLQALGIERLAVRATESAGHCPSNLAGIHLRNGTVLPTYDWITKPIEPR